MVFDMNKKLEDSDQGSVVKFPTWHYGMTDFVLVTIGHFEVIGFR